ncbi:hypothetical protein HUF18_09435 [Thalassolituus sp. ST750PaO-4]|uniref:cohesin domain-containing protein n=1 Tax=Thalassolituus sp. ST750PaO-4 TaxID=2742965 RepID=UPI000C51A480|nr:cohesin domain-containing protein [Thalassolituus sp. ST750PaO-4]MCA6059994.1 hypothetical protein [Thalassolituus sp. ST750PaO-4]PIQ40187.1 MAG: hypothetical protein COW58_07410 [Thalassolituus sp. CG17_big_fil_post_rev_8_21_14_2_50_53_8]
MKLFLNIVFLLMAAASQAEMLKIAELDRDGVRWLVVSADQLNPLYGIDVEMTFSSDRLEIVTAGSGQEAASVVPGELFGDGTFTIVNRADIRAGKIRYAASVLNPAPEISGSGVLFSIPFRAKGKDAGEFAIVNAEAGTRDGIKRTLPGAAVVKVLPPQSLPSSAAKNTGYALPAEIAVAAQSNDLPVWLLVVLAAVLFVLILLAAVLLRRIRQLEQQQG